LRANFVEVYNEAIFDLLKPKSNDKLRIFEDALQGVFI